MITSFHEKFGGYRWRGALPPQYIFSNRRFKKVLLDPPDFNPGSWRGAGNVLVDHDDEEFWLTTRPRRIGVRGYAVEIYRSKDGEDYSLTTTMKKEEIASEAGIGILSIEGQQLLRDPLTGLYHLYLAVDVGRGWETLLLRSDDPVGPWESQGVTLARGSDYDSREARDAVIDIFDGIYHALYKATDASRTAMALATSVDGISWKKHGLLTVAESAQPKRFLLNGNFFEGSANPIFIGFESTAIINGALISNEFVAYLAIRGEMRLEPIFKGLWEPGSPYEKDPYPVHSYVDMVLDPFKRRILMYVEAIDPKHSVDYGVDLEVDRLLLYEVPL